MLLHALYNKQYLLLSWKDNNALRCDDPKLLHRKVRQLRILSGNDENIAGIGFQIIRRNLSGHVHGNPAFQSEHHFFKRTVKMMNLIQMQTFFRSRAIPNIHFFGKSGSFAISVMGISLYMITGLFDLERTVAFKNEVHLPSFLPVHSNILPSETETEHPELSFHRNG